MRIAIARTQDYVGPRGNEKKGLMKDGDSNTSGSSADNPIRQFRLTRGLTQLEFAKACELHPSMVSQIERRHVVPSLQVAFRIAQYTGLPMDRIARFCLGQALDLSSAVVVDFVGRRKSARK